MKRVSDLPKRENLTQVYEEIGYYSYDENDPYFLDGDAYELSVSEADILADAAEEVCEICVEAAHLAVDRGMLDQFGIPKDWQDYAATSLKRGDPMMLSRLDFAYDGNGQPKFLEHNSDMLGDIVETSRLQEEWRHAHGFQSQMNRMEENLIATWKRLTNELTVPSPFFYMGDMNDPNIHETVEFLLYTAGNAGVNVAAVDLSNVDWDGENYVDDEGTKMRGIHKMLAWDEIMDQEFGQFFLQDTTAVIDPVWSTIVDSKAILPLMWEVAPNHPNLLPAYFNAQAFGDNSYVSKPIRGFAGGSVAIHDDQDAVSNQGEFDDQPKVYQEYHRMTSFDGKFPVCGMWMVNQRSAALSIREDQSRITGAKCRMVPHYLK